MTGTWQTVVNQPPAAIDTMLLLTDGSVMCHQYDSPNWYRLTPNAFSDYSNGSWSLLTPMAANAPAGQNGPLYAPLYYASAVLRDGRVFVAGGEYNVSLNPAADVLAAQIYDPVRDAWTSVPNPPGFANIGDAPTAVLPDGRILMGDINSPKTVIYDPEKNSWAAGGPKNDASSEESWTLLPDGTILCADVNNHPAAEKYLIATNSWVSAGSVPAAADLVWTAAPSTEIGPAILMNDGRVFCVGATGHTALYNPPLDPTQPGTWAAGPDFPTDASGKLMRALDAPACLLPNGKVLCVVGGLISSGSDTGWAGIPTLFFEFDGAALIPTGAPAGAANAPTFNCRLLLLPTGQVFYSDCVAGDLAIYTPDGGPKPAWRPHIEHVRRTLVPDHHYELRGYQLNGLSQAVSYGDDAQMATNYPIVRLRNSGTVGVVYCRTFNHSTMGVATGHSLQSTHFHVPPHIPLGDYELTVIANGIPSDPVEIRVVRHEEEEEEEDERKYHRPRHHERDFDDRYEYPRRWAEYAEKCGDLAKRIDRIEDAIIHSAFYCVRHEPPCTHGREEEREHEPPRQEEAKAAPRAKVRRTGRQPKRP